MRAPQLVVLALALTGCIDDKLTSVQDPTVPTNFTLKDHPFQGEGKTIEEWWNAFADPKLKELCSQAQANSFDLSSAKESLRACAYKHGMSEQEVEAQLNGTAKATPEASSVEGAIKIDDSFINAFISKGEECPCSLCDVMHDDYNINFFSGTFSLDIFNAVEQQLRGATCAILHSKELLQAAQNLICNQISKEYINLRLNQNIYQYLQTAYTTLQTSVGQLQERIKAGLNAKEDANEGEMFLKQIELTQADLEDKIQTAIHNISRLTGNADVAVISALVGDMGPIPPVNENLLAGTPIDAVKNRADLRAKYRKVQQAATDVNSAVIDQYPQLNIKASLETSAATLFKLLNGNSITNAIGVQLGNNFFNTRANTIKTRVQKSKMEQTQIEYNKAIHEALLQVAGSMANVVTSQKKDLIQKTISENVQNALQEAIALTAQDGKFIPKLISVEKNKILVDIQSFQSVAAVPVTMLDLLAALGG